jgi:hypothetical protein
MYIAHSLILSGLRSVCAVIDAKQRKRNVSSEWVPSISKLLQVIRTDGNKFGLWTVYTRM